MTTTNQAPLSDELLIGVEQIAAFTGEDERRQRYLIQRHGFPHVKRGGRIYSSKSQIREYYSTSPDGCAK